VKYVGTKLIRVDTRFSVKPVELVKFGIEEIVFECEADSLEAAIKEFCDFYGLGNCEPEVAK
jgi:hypothetical protein